MVITFREIIVQLFIIYIVFFIMDIIIESYRPVMNCRTMDFQCRYNQLWIAPSRITGFNKELFDIVKCIYTFGDAEGC
jgi:hypothetical protein